MPKQESKQYIVHVVSHTHWDREWYLTFQQYRYRLVDLIDHLIEIMERDPDYKHFQLDGQTIILEDYLEIRPENEERLRKLVGAGRILVGPWYTLPDYFLTSGEACVRNVLRGIRQAKEFSGGKYMNIGYSPDSFGNNSQFPQFLTGFGIDNAVFGRWIDVRKSKAEFWWGAPDGSKVLAHFMHCWYNNLQRFGSDIEKATELTEKAIERLLPYTTTNHLLFMNGVDHLEPQADLSKVIKEVNKRLKNAVLIHSTLPDFIKGVKQGKQNLKTFQQEMREGDDGALIPGVLSSRIELKHLNHDCQTALEKWAEPFSVFTQWLTGEKYPKQYIDTAWKYLLRNHPHDSICGCSIDPVHQDMPYRFRQARQIAEEIITRKLQTICKQIDTSKMDDNAVGLVVFNPSASARTETIKATVNFKNWDKVNNFIIQDEKGSSIPFTINHQKVTYIPVLNPVELPQAVKVNQYDITLNVSQVPAFGYKTYQAIPIQKPRLPQYGDLVTSTNTLENEFLKVEIQPNGSLKITHKETMAVYENCAAFEDGGDRGDAYNYDPPVNDEIYTTLSESPRISLVEDSPVRAQFKIEYDWALPHSLTPDFSGRSKTREIVNITSYISLTEFSKTVNIETEINNTIKNHRLRVVFPSGIPSDVFHADSQFDVVTRPIAIQELPPNCGMPRTHIFPQLSFMSIDTASVIQKETKNIPSDETVKGLSILSIAQPEFEVKTDEIRTIAVTLLRGTGRIFRDWGTPPDQSPAHPANWTAFGIAEEAQSLGNHTFKYAIYPHEGTWLQANAHTFAQELGTPLRTEVTDKHSGSLPYSKSFLEISSNHSIMVSAIKRAEDTTDTIIRLLNLDTKTTKAKIKLIKPAQKVSRVNLNEQTIEKLKDTAKEIRSKVEGKQIISFKAKL